MAAVFIKPRLEKDPGAEILERAKGLEPSTPTLARSCSTTELHPHPRSGSACAADARTYAKCRRRLQQKDEGIRQVPLMEFFAGFSPANRQIAVKAARLRLAAPLRGNAAVSARLQITATDAI
jgi:hypothetical protein